MLIEDTNKKTLQAAKFWELSNLRFRFVQVYTDHLQKGAEGGICGMPMPEFMNRYVQLRLEMAKRSIPIRSDTDLDRQVADRIRKRAIWTIDVPGLAEIPITENFISLTGDFVRDPKGTDAVTIVAKAEPGAIPSEIEKQIIRAVAREADKNDGEIVYQPAGPEETSLPIFDLVLRAKSRTKKIAGMKKDAGQDPELEKAAKGMEPSTSDEFHRVPVQAYKPNGKLRFFWISEEKGIKALEDMSRKMILAFLFTVDKWTMAEAKAWVEKFKKEKLEKTEKAAEVAAWTPQDDKEREAENKKIDANRATAEAANQHAFVEAKFPGWDGGPRCLICGERKPIAGDCPGTAAPFSTWDKYYGQPKRILADISKAEEPEAEEDLEKIETTENYHRIPVLPKDPAAKIRTIRVSQKEGILALYDTGRKKIVTYLFDREKWSLEEAKTWIADHKPEKRAAAALRKGLGFRIQKIEAKKQMAGGIIYEPDTVDTQDDYTDAEEITEAKERFMEKYGKDPKRIKVMHKGKAYFFPIIESFQPEVDTKKGAGIIKAGAWWMMVKISDPDIWAAVEKGELQGFSMGGRARSGS